MASRRLFIRLARVRRWKGSTAPEIGLVVVEAPGWPHTGHCTVEGGLQSDIWSNRGRSGSRV